jgi:hypothetical protein
MIDLKKLDVRPGSDDGRWLTLRDPDTDQELPGSRLKLLGADSKIWKDLQLEQRRARLDFFESSGKTRIDPGRADEEDLSRLIAATVAWEGIGNGAEPLPLTAANVRDMYLAVPEFRAQAIGYIITRANFRARSASAY